MAPTVYADPESGESFDGLEPQQTTEIIAIHNKSEDIESMITSTLNQTEAKMVERKKRMEDLENATTTMDALSGFEKTTYTPVWTKESSPTRNYLCNKPNCHSTCAMDCGRCPHLHSSHYHAFAEWVEKKESHVTVDEKMKKKWRAAKVEKERIEGLVAKSEREVGNLSLAMEEGMDELARLVEEYAGLALSGRFSGPLERTIRVLEARCQRMEEGGNRDQLQKMRASLEGMIERLNALRKAKE